MERYITYENFERVFSTVVGKPIEPRREYDRLIGLYSVGRHYHDITHVGFLLRIIDHIKERLDDPALVMLAAFYHDVIYVPGSQDNEAKSAWLAKSAILIHGGDSTTADQLVRLVLATSEETYFDLVEDEKYLYDVDRTTLGTDFDSYMDVSTRIRREFLEYDDETFLRGRKSFLEKMLDKEVIYKTKYFRDLYEDTARTNMRREIDEVIRPMLK